MHDVETAATPTGDLRERMLAMLSRHWGYDSLRPLQEEAVMAGIEGRDSLVVLPTGGGKSLCYQLPPLLRGGTDLVISPLISLMKDQVDGLEACGYPAVALNSGMSDKEQRRAEHEIAEGTARLVFAAPERVFNYRTLGLLKQADVRSIVIDEAHCISHWGHDFRPEYRRLTQLRSALPDASWHAFTATATERVREDIAAQLSLRDPAILVGDCDRPNLVYRVLPRVSARDQLLEVLQRHADEAAIVYCISRKDTEKTADWLNSQGVHAAAYHAGLAPQARQRIQDAFMAERLHVVVATVAFGMGIDRSDVRCVVHLAMPKSIEHYQQEAGRAGRDGLEAECVLLYSSADVQRWRRLMDRAGQEAGDDCAPEHQVELLEHMRRFCASMTCRHRALSEYFGQPFDADNCGACDVCLEESTRVEDAVVVAQKILSCVARLRESFGAAHVVDVLRGSGKEKIRRMGHDALSVYGLMADIPAPALQSFIEQLIDQGALARTEGDRPILRMTGDSGAFLRGERDVTLRCPRVVERAAGRHSDASWEGVDRELFERLRALRREIAHERGVPAYIVFGDGVLREMARIRPTSRAQLLEVKGVGSRKLEEFGDFFLACIAG
jgi:ATP-dependent DNA helicase RecQ